MRQLLLILCRAGVGFALTIAIGSAAYAEEGKRIALLIGNANYKSVPTLRNPTNDVALIAQALAANRFDVDLKTNLDGARMRRVVREFTSRLQASGKDTVGLIYFAGHGIQIRENNYLLPVDAEIKKATLR